MRTVVSTLILFACVVGCGSRPHKDSPIEDGGRILWSPLSEFKVVSKRPATKDDVAANRAVFVAQSNGVLIGIPIEVDLPQYAYHVDVATGEKTPGVLIQAEEAGDQQLAGFIILPFRTIMAGMLPEFELLSTQPPN